MIVRIALILISLGFITNSSATDVSVAVSARSDSERQLRQQLSDVDIKALFQFVVSKLPDGDTAEIVLLPNDSLEHRVFLIKYIGMSQSAYDRYLALQTNGRKNTPVTLKAPVQVYFKLSNSTSAIGYVDQEIADVLPNDKIILIEDK